MRSMHGWRRVLVGGLAIAALILGTSLPAVAAVQMQRTDCWENGCYDGIKSHIFNPKTSNWRGAHAAMQMAWMLSGASSGYVPNHMNTSLWTSMSANNYIEAGVVDGFALPNGNYCDAQKKQCIGYTLEAGSAGSSTCYSSGCNAYYLYWSDHDVAGNGYKWEHHHVVRFLSPSPSAVLYIDIFRDGGHWTINFSGAFNYHAVSGLEDAYTKVYDIQLGAEYRGPARNGQCLGSDQMSAALWDQNMNIQPYNTQDGPTHPQDAPFRQETGPNGYLGISLPSGDVGYLC